MRPGRVLGLSVGREESEGSCWEGSESPEGGQLMSNQIMVIAPYWLEEVGTWVFDDPAAGLCQEPFVSGVPEMIDFLVKNIPNGRAGFRLLFSAAPFPGYQKRLTWKREEMGGNWYASQDPPNGGLALPRAVSILRSVPAQLYVKAEAKGE